MAKRTIVPSDDYREFVHRSTGRTRKLNDVSPVELHDTLAAELDPLKALGELLRDCEDPLEAAVARGMGEILRDIEERMRAILAASRRAAHG